MKMVLITMRTSIQIILLHVFITYTAAQIHSGINSAVINSSDPIKQFVLENDLLYIRGLYNGYIVNPTGLNVTQTVPASTAVTSQPTYWKRVDETKDEIFDCESNANTCRLRKLSDLSVIGTGTNVGAFPAGTNEAQGASRMIIHPTIYSDTNGAISFFFVVSPPFTKGLSIRNPGTMAVVSMPNPDDFTAGETPVERNYITTATESVTLEFFDIVTFESFQYIFKNSVNDQDNPARIASVCEEDDIKFSSHTEIALACGNDYNYIQSLFVSSKLGGDLKNDLTVRSDDPNEVYVFAVMGLSRTSQDTKLCALHVSKLRQEFQSTYVRCRVDGDQNIEFGPPELNTREDCVSSSGIDGNQSICNIIKTSSSTQAVYNPTPIQMMEIIGLNFTATSMKMILNDRYSVAVMTDAGSSIYQVLLGSSKKGIYRRKDIPTTTPLTQQVEILDSKMYVASNATVFKLNLYSCSKAMNCNECTALQDPFCGWCALSQRCTTSNECQWENETDHWLQKQCINPDNGGIEDLTMSTELSSTGQAPTQEFKIYYDIIPKTTANMPTYKCCFEFSVTQDTCVNATTVAEKATRFYITCKSPQNIRDLLSFNNEQSVKRPLKVVLGTHAFIETEVTYFDCSALSTLVVCSRSQRLAQQYQQTFQNSLGFSINDLLRTMPVKLTIGDGEMAKCEEGKSYCTPTSNLYHDDDNDGGSGFSTDEPFLTDVPKVTNLTEGTTPFSQACIYCTPQLCAHEVPEPPSYTDAVVSLTASGTPSLPYWRPLNASHNSPICQISVSKLGDTARIGGNYFQNCSRPELLLSRSENYTLTFTITSLTANITSQSFLFFRIFLPMDRSKVLEGVPNIYFRYGVNKTQSGQIAFTAARASHGAPYESLSPIPSQTMLNELNITLQFIRSDDGYRIYHYTNGEIAEIVHLPADFDQNVTSTAFQVYLQGSDMLYSNIKLYNIIVLASELYELRTGRKVEYRVVPECKCPRDNPDDFGRWGAVSRGVTVTAIADCGSTPRIYHGDESQLSASVNIEEVVLKNSANGGLRYDYAEWISDYTESIDLYIDLHQNMQIFAVSLVTSNIPEKLEVYFSGGYSQRRAVVYLADDCNAAYNKKPNQLAFTDTFQESANRFRRAALNEPTVRCYEWKSVAKAGVQSFLEVQTNSELYEVLIPIVGTSDFNNALDPHYISQEIHIRMIGHLLAEEDDQRYYSITAGQLQVYGRPFCNGANSQFRELTDYNSYTGYYEYLQTMNEPYYTCQCPSNITGSDCTSCNANQTWQITPAVCVDCECSDLSVGPDCDQKTGQCPCIDGMDLELAGRHCNFYMDSIDPLYGPRSGGTRITFSGFFDTDNYRVDLRVHSGNYRVQLEWNTTTFSNGTGLVTTSEYKVSNSRYAPEFPTEVTLEFILIDIRDSKVLIQFQYRPDPIIEEIYPRQMPLSGGTISRVYGKYINSVAYPSMTIDIRVENMTYGTFETGCTVINETLMECETPNLLEFWVNFTRRQTSVPLPAPTTRGATEPATSITATTLSTPRPTGFNGTGGQPLVRRKRQTKSSPPDGINEDYLNGQYKISFIMGFKLDGVDKFEDLSQVENLREQAEIFVFRDPIVEAFDPEIQDYKSGLIEIKGSGMTSGVIMSDYDIEIGKGKCDMKALDDNRLTCQPPEEEPEIDRDSSIEDHPHVRVRVGNRETFLGYLKYFSSPWDYAWVRGVVITVIVIVGLAVLAVIVWYCVKMKRRERDFKLRQRSMQKKLENKYHPNQTGQMTEKSALFAELHQNLRTTIARCEIPADRLTKGGVVGKGNFGRVYKGQLVLPNGMMKAVAVKSLKENDVTVEVIEDFLKEALIMVDFRHDNVLSLIGVVWEEGDRPMVVIPYMDNGDLRKVVMNSDIRLTLGDLLHFCYQISNGMEYLGDKKFVHRDLAARNCMVNGEGKLKIADFGLSRDLFEKDYYKIQDETRGLPIKWMAIESIVHGKFTSKSDVWSFAVTCWEVFTLGSTPYPAVDNYSMRKHIERGGRLDKPPNCPDIIFEMMKRCWFDAPEERPSFGSISQLLANILHIDNDPQQEQDQLETAYDRAYTIEIPDDYLNASAGQSDDYMYFQPMAAEESENVPPKPAARFQAAAPDNVYINV